MVVSNNPQLLNKIKLKLKMDTLVTLTKKARLKAQVDGKVEQLE
jgi:hypothetical protein